MNTSIDLELAWAAGFFDGEGNSGYWDRGCVAQITQVDREVLDRFHSAVTIGNVRGPYLNKKGRGYYNWTANGIPALTILYDKIGPYLSSVKKRQLREALNEAVEYKNGYKQRITPIARARAIRVWANRRAN